MIGKTLGPCLIEAELGRGAMGVVYRARHLSLDRPVAVKVVSGLTERAIKEARTVARLEDPRIVQVFDAGQTDGVGWIVMQLVSGRTLHELVAGGAPLPPAEALSLMKEVLSGLGVAHAAGIVHRDVKPANIMVDAKGAPRLMDFGLAASSTASGTWDYMAPEQGFGAAADPRMDLYSFGATWFFTLAGRPPFVTGQRSDLLIMHRETPPPDVREFAPRVTRPNAELINCLLAKDPAQRPAAAAEVLERMARHDMILNVDVSGSPFALLPPVHDNAIPDVVQEERLDPGLPGSAPAVPPPPPPPVLEPPSPWPARLMFGALYLGLSGRHWLTPTPLDAMIAAALPWPWVTGPMLALYGWLGGPPTFELWVGAGVAAVCLAAAWLLGNRWLWAGALAVGLILFRDRLPAEYAGWAASGGWWRWAGTAAVIAWWAGRLPRRERQVAPAVSNWFRPK